MEASAADLMVALFYSPGSSGEHFEEIKGITRLEKLVFLLLKEGGFEDKLAEDLNYEAYDYGPYSGEVYDLVEALENIGLLDIEEEETSDFKENIDEIFLEYSENQNPSLDKRVDIYKLDEEKGQKVWEKNVKDKFTSEELETIKEIKEKYNHIELRELLRYVYENYPDSTKKSKILDEILGFGERPDLTSFVREE